MKNNSRRVQLNIGTNIWKDIEFNDLKKDDIFRMYEPDGRAVTTPYGELDFKAMSNAYYSEDLESMTIDIKKPNETNIL